MSQKIKNPNFEEMSLSPEILKAIGDLGFDKPTKIQSKAIPPLMQGRDIIAKAPTGTGKTFAFGIPIIECLNPALTNIQSLIICPTRELCIQIGEEMELLIKYRQDLRIAMIYGGVPISSQINELKKFPHIVVATPGRILDHMQRRTANIGSIYTLVFDEADEMFKMGFVDDVKKIIRATPKDVQVAMFSATLSREVMDVSWQYQSNPLEVNVDSVGENRPDITQFNLISVGANRFGDMTKIINEFQFKRVMVFCNMKSTTEQVCRRMKQLGLSVKALNGDIPQVKRNSIMNAFRDGKFDILVATDVAARGIDIEDVELVLNYDVPDNNEYYLHRIGRTGRAKRSGFAITFSAPHDNFKLRDIRKYTNSDITDIFISDKGEFVLENGELISDVFDVG